MKIRILLWSVVSILILGLAVGACWWRLRPQVITFDNGDKLTLLKVDYGKKHSPPNIKTATKGARGRRGNSFTTTNDTLVLWVQQQYDSKQWHNFQYFIYDQAGTACIASYGYSGNNSGNDVVGVRAAAFPRRDGKFMVRVQENSNGSNEIAKKPFVIRNPAGKSFSNWMAESLPTTKDDNDVSVTLKTFVAGVPGFNRNNNNPDDAMNKAVQAMFQVERNGKAVSNWQPVSVETFDATGNHVSGWVNQNNWQDGDDTVTYQYGLWPDEPAWKIRFEFSQQSDFGANELWHVQNLPVLPGKSQEMWNYAGNRRNATTNSPFAETDLNGFHLKIFPAKDFTDVGNNNWITGGLFIQVSPDVSNDYRMTVNVTDGQANNIQSNEYGTQRNDNITFYRYRLQGSAGLANLNVSIALHKSRFVEFTVKPEKAPAIADAQ